MNTLAVKVQPNASRSEIVSFDGTVLRVRLSAPPVEGKANAALIAFLAKTIGIRKSAITLLRGETSRDKLLAIEGLETEDLRRILESRTMLL